jgi:DNA mismatch repair protein MutS
MVGLGRIQDLRTELVDHSELAIILDTALVTDPPAHLREGGVIKPSYDDELDKLRDLSKNGKSYIASLEQKERERTGISNLKVGFNSVFGYYLEVSKTQIDRVPDAYIRKQTTAAGERYITAELKEHESLVLGAEEKAVSLESDLFHRLRLKVAGHARALLQTARALAEIDVLCALAEVALRRDYTKPEITEDDIFTVESARHPVVEAAGSGFVPNHLNLGDTRLIVLTGPNMAGKSTFLRQNAIIALMAQIGSFVPAKSCRLGLCDRIFARIGAKDELALGQSTFMVEMVESANILNHATERSLVILDEVGRGTSTYDGLAIAWAMVEHLAEIGAKTMFATHYHQLNSLAEKMPTVKNFRVAVEERGDDIVWTHRVLPGGADRSYGVHVARMAGVPSRVLTRANEILSDLEDREGVPKAVSPTVQRMQLSLFEFEEPKVVKELKNLDVNNLTPLAALRILDEWKRSL